MTDDIVEAQRSAAFTRRLRMWVVAILMGVAVVAGVAVLLLYPTEQPSPATTPQLPAVAAKPHEVVSAPPTQAQPTAAVRTPARMPNPIAEAEARLRARLDALAQAYEQGDVRAVERVLWPNHAVVRPDGELLDRAALLATWADEWQTLRNRNLDFYVENVYESGGAVTAVWTILLTADFQDGAGDLQHIMINGKQQATVLGSGDTERLDGPIVYVSFERTYNGFPWPLDEQAP